MGDMVKDTTDFLGLTDWEGEEEAEKRAVAAEEAATTLSKEQLDFQKAQYADWKDIYGSTQEQEADYVAKYTGEDIVSQKLASLNASTQASKSQLIRDLAQRGISGGGVEAAGLTYLAQTQASGEAGIRASQEDIASNKRLQFLGIGLGQGTQMLSTIAQASRTGVEAQVSIAGQQTALQGSLSTSSMKGAGTVVDTTGDIAGGYIAASDIRFKNNIELVKTIGNYNIYTWDWNTLGEKITKQKGKSQGLLAQEMLYVNPKSIVEVKGYYHIKLDYLPKELLEEIDYGK